MTGKLFNTSHFDLFTFEKLSPDCDIILFLLYLLSEQFCHFLPLDAPFILWDRFFHLIVDNNFIIWLFLVW